jgi:hypothetical protein
VTVLDIVVVCLQARNPVNAVTCSLVSAGNADRRDAHMALKVKPIKAAPMKLSRGTMAGMARDGAQRAGEESE